MARPTDLTEAVQKGILRALNTGASIRAASNSVGINEATYYRWMARGNAELNRIKEAEQTLANLPRGTAKTKRDAARKATKPLTAEEPFCKFCESVTRARAKVDIQIVSSIVQAAQNGDWRAGAWLMERRGDPEFYKVERTEISGPEGKPIETQALTPDYADPEVRRHAEGLLRLRSGRRRQTNRSK